METVRLSAGEAIVRFLDHQYVTITAEDGSTLRTKFVEYFYALFGHGCVLGVGEALANTDHSLRVMQGKNEQGMAQAAIAYAKQNNRRKIIPCISSIGPGAANMVTAAATATVNNIPLLLFMGDTFASRQPDPVLQQVEQPFDATITTNDAFRAVTRYFDRVTRPEHIMTALTNAMRVLTDAAHTGAVAIALCQDVQGECYDYPVEFFRDRDNHIRRAIPEEYEVERAVQAIRASRYPLVIAGGGVRYSLAGRALMALCEQCNIPIAETQAGKSAVPSSFYLNLGGVGATGNSAANTIAANADLVIGIGTRFSDFTTSSKWLFSGAQVVTLNASAFHAAKLDAISVVTDALTGIRAVQAGLCDYRTAYTNEIAAARDEWSREMRRLCEIEYTGEDFVPENDVCMPDAISAYIRAHGGYVCQTTALGVIREIIPDDAIVVGASGSLPGCLERMWTTDSVDSYNMEYGYSCMGYEIAGAFGSKLAEPTKEVYAMVGDGSYLMLHSEMITALQEGVKINVLLFDNASFGCINNLQMGQGCQSLCTELRYRDGTKPIREGAFLSIDFAASAAGYGFRTYSVHTTEELRAALIDSLHETSPVLIDIKTLPKTMTSGYGSWWNVGCTANPHTQTGEQAVTERAEHLAQARKY